MLGYSGIIQKRFDSTFDRIARTGSFTAPKFIYPFICCLALGNAIFLSAADYTVQINPDKDNSSISPYLYGSNGFNNYAGANMNCMRMGGNRLTGYNWENNASNAGTDWQNSSDGYLSNSLIPGKAVTDFVDNCRTLGQKSLVTVQMAGYVAADKNGSVQASEVAPSKRWKEVAFVKGAPFTLVPDTTDNKVYIDEMVNFMVAKYKKASEGGVFAYSLDNEPCLWSGTHPLIHPKAVGCRELVDKSIACAKAIKSIDTGALVFGPVLYGYNAYVNLQNSPDWNTVGQKYDWFIGYYLDQMKKASDSAGLRLLDILDLHWYPEAQGDGMRIIGSNAEVSDPVTPGANMARMQAPRSLYDTAYVETSWISSMLGGPIKLLPDVKKSINKYFPGTKIALTEFTYGAANHISGGIATADFLGAAGKNGVFMTNKWYVTYGYTAAAYKIFRNYNGSNAPFGTTACFASTSNIDSAAVYGSFNGTDKSVLHIIAINKASTAKSVAINISAGQKYAAAEVWGFNASDTLITKRASVSTITNNSFEYTMPALSVLHFVVSTSVSVTNSIIPVRLCYNATLKNNIILYAFRHMASISLITVAGKSIFTKTCNAGSGEITLSTIPRGMYLLCIKRGTAQSISRINLCR